VRAVGPYAEAQLDEINDWNGCWRPGRGHGCELGDWSGRWSASKRAARKMRVSTGLVVRMMRSPLRWQLIATKFQRQQATAGGHEADRHNCAERERHQQDAGDESAVTAIAVRTAHVPIGSWTTKPV